MDEMAPGMKLDTAMTQAAEWLLELQAREVSEKRIAAWQRWLMDDVRNRQAFDRLQALEEHIVAARELPWPSDQEVATDHYDGSVPVSTWQRRQSRTVSHASRLSWARWTVITTALAATVAGVVAHVAFEVGMPSFLHRTALETGIGELRRTRLADGSMITVDGNSRVSIDLKTDQRDVVLERGEAFFEVAKDPNRPFVVRAGTTAIKAVGTAFDVRRAGDDVTVSVAEGIVEVADHSSETPDEPPARVGAGHQVRVQPERTISPVSLSSDAVATWRAGQRQYVAEPLSGVVSDLSRYSKKKIIIADDAAGRVAVTGAVFERNIDTWLKSLEAALPVQVKEGADGTVEISTKK